MKKRNQTISTTNQYLRASNREAKQEKKSKNTSVTLLVPCGSRRMTRGPFKLNEPWNQCFHFLAHFVPSQKIFKIENIEKKKTGFENPITALGAGSGSTESEGYQSGKLILQVVD